MSKHRIIKQLEESKGIRIEELKIVKEEDLAFQIKSLWDRWGNGHIRGELGSETEMIVEPFPIRLPGGEKNNRNPKEWLIYIRLDTTWEAGCGHGCGVPGCDGGA